MNKEIQLQKINGIATITINRPDKRNAINYDGWIELQRLAKAVDQDKDIKVVIIQGSGQEAFSSGADIADFDDWDAKGNYTKDDFAVLEIVNDILKNYERFNIYNKKQLYVYIREATDLPSRKITKSLKKIKINYGDVRNSFIG